MRFILILFINPDNPSTDLLVQAPQALLFDVLEGGDLPTSYYYLHLLHSKPRLEATERRSALKPSESNAQYQTSQISLNVISLRKIYFLPFKLNFNTPWLLVKTLFIQIGCTFNLVRVSVRLSRTMCTID